MHELVKSVDVVIDQILTGSYGVAAVEAMAANRLVIGNVSPRVRALVPEEVPIIDCVPEELEATMRAICADRERFQSIALTGRGFACHLHDGRQSASALRPFLFLE
jgi:hypothetical protein